MSQEKEFVESCDIPVPVKKIKKFHREKDVDLMPHEKESTEPCGTLVPVKKNKKYHRKKDLNFMAREKKFDLYHGPPAVPIEQIQKYQRGKPMDLYGITGHANRVELMIKEKKMKQSVRQAARNELLLTEEPGFIEPDKHEDTYKITQNEIAAAVDITSASKLFSLNLADFGPYKVEYFCNGRVLLLGGRRGHIATMDWITKELLCEFNVMESVHAVSWLHMPTMFAVAQKNWVYIYDNQGVELHCLKKLDRILNMEFLPYHFLLVSASEKGFLSWLDVSVGKMIRQTYTNFGRLNIMCQNPYNAVIATGHPNGAVNMWSPNEEKPLASILCHPHALRSIAIDTKGLYLATASSDNKLKIFDVRTFKCLQSYKIGSSAQFLDFSQTGLLSVGMQHAVEVYRESFTRRIRKPYLRHKLTSTISDVKFCPYEDVLGIGYSTGFSSILIPGAGQPNFDAYECNPFMTKSQQRELEVKSLLDKIQPELITLDPGQLGTVNVKSLKESIEKKKSILYVKPPHIEFEPRPKMKSRSKSAQKFKRKKIVKEAAKREFIKSAVSKTSDDNVKVKKTKHKNVLDRFKPNCT